MTSSNQVSAVIKQANIFFNYTVGFDYINIDLLKTASKLLKAGIANSIFFSDFRYLYQDNNGDIQISSIENHGRRWDSIWKINFEQVMSTTSTEELVNSVTLSYHEKKLGLDTNKYSKPYLRAELPPFVIEDSEGFIPIHVSAKIFNDGIIILSFHLEINEEVDEEYFIENIVNIYRQYFSSIWVNEKIQRLDAEEILPGAFDDVFTIAGHRLHNWKIRRLVKKMRMDSKAYLDEWLSKDGQFFDIGDNSLELHEIAGSKHDDSDELSIDTVRSQYTNAISNLLVSTDSSKSSKNKSFIWVGRPSISLLRFNNQPLSKSSLYEKYHPFLVRMLVRTSEIDIPYELPIDLRPFNDYSFHGNRALLLWTWLKTTDSPEDWWDDEDAYTNLLENQARAEHIEYHNMRTERAASWALSPPSSDHLIQSFKDLAFTDEIIHHSSHAGEITDALSHLLNDFGTIKLIAASKESARWHLDEIKYRADLKRSQVDRMIALVFGLVGTTGLADFAIKPYIEDMYPEMETISQSLTSLGISALIVVSITALIYISNSSKSSFE